MSKKALAITGTVVAIAALVVGFGWWIYAEMPNGVYYTQVDNTRTEKLESRGGIVDLTGGMSIGYTLPAFDESGTEKDIAFGTERELRDGAYLRLSAVPIRGVMEWSEVQFDEIPAKAQAKLPAPTLYE